MAETATKANVARAARWVAVALIVAGLVIGLGAGWRWYGKVRQVAAEQRRLDQALVAQWAGAGGAGGSGDPAGAGRNGAAAAAANPVRTAPARRGAAVGVGGADDAVPLGTPIARLHLPTISKTLVAVEGAGDKQLNQGPGRMTNTAPFGEPGNTALAGHRYPSVFWSLDLIELGDPVIVETADSWLVYRTVRTVIVEPVDQTVLAPPPAGTPALLTLLTCEPKLSTSRRLVKQATLIRSDPRAGPPPKELETPTRR
jgi:sortase A